MQQARHILILFALAALAGCRAPAARAQGAGHPAVALIEAGRSAPNDAERRASAGAAARLERWLTEAGLTVRRVSEDAVTRNGLADRVAILPYNPVLPPALRNRLAAFVKGGGRLIVFYSSDPELAALLGLRLGAYTPAAEPGQWSAIAFTAAAPPLAPARLLQTSRNIRPVSPLNARGRIMAWWEDAAGNRRPEPAWAITDRGAWMSHVLLDGDAAPRRRLLLALAGHFDPRLLQTAARRALARGGAAAPFTSGPPMIEAIRARAPGHAALARELAALETGLAALPALYERGRYTELIAEEDRLADRLLAAYARAQPNRPGEFRAVWNHTGLGLYEGPDSWERTCRLLAEHGFTAVFPNIAWAGLAHYPSRFLPQSAAGRAAGDPLQACVTAAARHRLAVHAWKICWNLEGAPEPLVARFKAQNRLQQDAAGNTLNWLCPSRPENVAWELDAIAEIAERYPVAGVHLDYIRFPGSHACFCPACRAAFERAAKVKVRQWPRDVRPGGPHAARFIPWRAGQISTFVRLAQQRLRQVRPAAALSAAVYGYYPGCIASMGQDWGDWLRNGWIAFVCPMNYEEDTDRFAAYVRSQLPLARHNGQIIPGLGITSTQSRLNAVQTLDQIQAARAAGAGGFILFDLNRTLEQDILPYLKLGATAP